MILRYRSFYKSSECGATSAPGSSNQGDGSENKNKAACFNNVDMGMQEEQVVRNSADKSVLQFESMQLAGELFKGR